MNTTTDSVRIVLFEKSLNKFIVLSETDDPTNLKLPGGKFDTVHETPHQAAARELREELGLDTDVVTLKLAGELVNDDGVSKRFIFRGLADPAMVKPSAEIDHVEWVTEETVPEGKNQRHIKSAVECAKALKSFPGNLEQPYYSRMQN